MSTITTRARLLRLPLVRPFKDPDARASAIFRIRLTAAERAELDAKAAAAGVTLSRLVRAAALRYRLPQAPVTVAMVRELQAIGINLNQIARQLNTTGELADHAALRDATALLKATLSEVLDAALRDRHGEREESEDEPPAFWEDGVE